MAISAVSNLAAQSIIMAQNIAEHLATSVLSPLSMRYEKGIVAYQIPAYHLANLGGKGKLVQRKLLRGRFGREIIPLSPQLAEAEQVSSTCYAVVIYSR